MLSKMEKLARESSNLAIKTTEQATNSKNDTSLLTLKQSANYSIVFFSHNKSANNTFYHDLIITQTLAATIEGEVGKGASLDECAWDRSEEGRGRWKDGFVRNKYHYWLKPTSDSDRLHIFHGQHMPLGDRYVSLLVEAISR